MASLVPKPWDNGVLYRFHIRDDIVLLQFESVFLTSGTREYSDTCPVPMICLHRPGARPTGGGAIPLPQIVMAEGRLHHREVVSTKCEK